MISGDNERIMLRAVELAERGRWLTPPNPCVGAVLVKDGIIIAEGWHRGYGYPHAEVEAITDCRRKGFDPADCSLWVTLEPCNHIGKTPPCTRAILEAGIGEVFVGTTDPNPFVTGGSVAFLREQGVIVHTDIAFQACKDLIADFRVWKLGQRPYVVLKLACTLDGKIATRIGHSQWISGPEARAEVHKLRSRVQAVLVGGHTFVQDNPRLTARRAEYGRSIENAIKDKGLFQQPLAIVVTSCLPKPDAPYYLLQHRPTETIFFTTKSAAASKNAIMLKHLGCRVWGLNPSGRNIDLSQGLHRLWKDLQCSYLLCEGGNTLGIRLFNAGLADELWLYLAPKVLGDAHAIALFTGRNVRNMNQALMLRICSMRQVGQDVALVLRTR
ncbi:5-amino-6-(5-phosphoribosylamino)uracil reductase / Diaminohydroxyphosphoribosylaminopyrimidine deaminase [Desulfovibrionales bacterium]